MQNSGKFDLVSKFSPMGDQPQAIEKLVEGVNDGLKEQVLLGVTGSGKTFVMANIIKNLNRPALVLAHNKTLAAQLCNEFKDFFPNNRVEFFVSYYDYYQPEAYIVQTDTYIEKDLSINDEIDKLRSSATASLLEDRNTIIVSSVSCIYGLGNPEEYDRLAVSLRPGQEVTRTQILQNLVNIQYVRNDMELKRSTFRVRGDIIDVCPSYSSDTAIRIELFGDEVDRLSEIDILTGKRISELKHAMIYPATHYAVGSDKLNNVLGKIAQDAEIEVEELKQKGKLIEAQRLKERVSYDIEMMREMGYCSGIENYSRYFDGRDVGTPPFTLLDYFPDDFVLFIDESHITLPQIRAMYNGDKSRKTNLVDYGFRMKSAFDNRPLTFEEFNERLGQIIYVSATPGKYELERAGQVAECLIRPTGLLDPKVEVRKIEGQIDDLIYEIKKTTENNGRTLVTTLTKKMSERLTDYLHEYGIKVKYLHSEIDTMERIEIINGLRNKDFDCIVGINLLREGLDIPEVQLVAILDADKEGFLRSTTSLIQTIGRAARTSESRGIMYADNITDSMKRAIDETNRRREIQDAYNKKHNIVPKTIIKDIKNELEISKKVGKDDISNLDIRDIPRQIELLKGLMKTASASLDFEKAISLRDEISELKSILEIKKKEQANQKYLDYLKNKRK
ncbi:MAG: excinuclease ABC subunit UvrB [Clostridia bacterium]|nr:excinuclease ABC subunit UvrB [Clostridia bacterium]